MASVGAGAHGELEMAGVMIAGVAGSPHPFVNRAAVAIASHVAINPVDGAATMVIGDASTLAAMAGFS